MKPPPDLRTLAGARELAIDMQGVARKFYEEHQGHPLIGTILATRAPPPSFFMFTGYPPFEIKDGRPALVTIMASQVGCEGDRDRFAIVMHLMSKILDAVGTITIFEGWYLAVPARTSKEARAYRDTLPRSLEDAPGRLEAILIMLEHAQGSLSFHAFITREGERGILGDFIEHETKFEGRFADTLGKQSAS